MGTYISKDELEKSFGGCYQRCYQRLRNCINNLYGYYNNER